MLAVDEDPEERNTTKSHLSFPVGGIGASAGGIGALQKLFAGLPADTGMAFVVVMHLSPDHESSLGSILQRVCGTPVITVTASQAIRADHIYLVSPSKKLVMTDGELRVSELTTIQGRQRSIDLFSAALPRRIRKEPSAWCCRAPAPMAPGFEAGEGAGRRCHRTKPRRRRIQRHAEGGDPDGHHRLRPAGGRDGLEADPALGQRETHCASRAPARPACEKRCRRRGPPGGRSLAVDQGPAA